MKIKMCGMTNLEDVLCAVDLGVDFVGFVFYEKSKRFIGYEETKKIIDKVNSNIKKVGVFVEQSDKEILDVVNFCSLDYAQVYRQVEGVNTIVVYRIRNKLPKNVDRGFVLFDSYTKLMGGSGISFDVEIVKNFNFKDRLFVAGGVSVNNIERIAEFGVFGVDLVSSIEQYPGKKDKRKMEDFMRIVRRL